MVSGEVVYVVVGVGVELVVIPRFLPSADARQESVTATVTGTV